MLRDTATDHVHISVEHRPGRHPEEAARWTYVIAHAGEMWVGSVSTRDEAWTIVQAALKGLFRFRRLRAAAAAPIMPPRKG